VNRVRVATRKVDILVRRGGEEFVLVMPGTTSAQATVIAERVRASAADTPIVVGAASIRQTVSIGVAAWDGRESPEALQRRADEAMYDAKARGRNWVEVAQERKTRPRLKVAGKSAPKVRRAT
jgi:two-component system cell cycle response regulator